MPNKFTLPIEDYYKFSNNETTARELAELHDQSLSTIHKELASYRNHHRGDDVRDALIQELRQSIPHDPEYGPSMIAKRYGFYNLSAALQFCRYKSLIRLRHEGASEAFFQAMKEHGLSLVGNVLKKAYGNALELTQSEVWQLYTDPGAIINALLIRLSLNPVSKRIQKKPRPNRNLLRKHQTLSSCIELARRHATYREIQQKTGAHAKVVTRARQIAELYTDDSWMEEMYTAEEIKQIRGE